MRADIGGSRSARDLLNDIQTLKDYSVTFISLKEGIGRSVPYGQFMLTILAAIAELEMEIITSRMKKNRLARWRDRRIFCGKPPYGYVWNSKEKRIEIVVEVDQGEVYSGIVKEYLDLGRSLNDISIDLNAEGVQTRNDGLSRWSSGTLSKILKCADYCGEITVNRFVTDVKGRIVAHRIVLKNLDSLLEHEDFDRTEYSQKRNGNLAEIHALHRKMEDTRKELDEIRKRKSDEADFAKFVSEADAFKAVPHKIMKLPLPDKQRHLCGVLEGPITVGDSTLIPLGDTTLSGTMVRQAKPGKLGGGENISEISH